MYKLKGYISGFSLLELLIVVAIVAILASFSVGYYVNYGKNVEINSVTQSVVFDLKQAQSKSMTGEGGLKWGIHFVNNTNDYYEFFSTPTDYSNASKVIITTKYLSNGVIFTTPSANSSLDIIFDKISGRATQSSVVLSYQNLIKTLSISSIGNISVQ